MPLFTCACESNVQISHSVTKDPGCAGFKLTKKYLAFPQSQQNLVPTPVSVVVIFGSLTKIIYDTVKVIHHSPPGALICLFVFSGGAKLLSLDFMMCMIHVCCVL